MRRYLLDTFIVSDVINDRHGIKAKVSRAKSQGDRIGTSTPVIGELFYGILLTANATENLKRLRHGLADLICWSYGVKEAEKFGELTAELHLLGFNGQQIDVQTAAIALTLANCTVVTTDSDFNRIPGLSVENWRVS
jgi:tRNA(fMet)-specific endonuclease VapC